MSVLKNSSCRLHSGGVGMHAFRLPWWSIIEWSSSSFQRSFSVLMNRSSPSRSSDLPLGGVAPWDGALFLLVLLSGTVRVGIQQSTKKICTAIVDPWRSAEANIFVCLRLERRHEGGAIVNPCQGRQQAKIVRIVFSSSCRSNYTCLLNCLN